MSTPSAAPQLRRWSAPRVLLAPGPLTGLDADALAGYEVLGVAVAAGGPPDAAATGAVSPDTATDGAAPRPVLVRPGSAQAAARYGVDLVAECAAEGVAAAAGTATRLPVAVPAGAPRKLLAVGVGAGASTDLRRAGAALARAAGATADVVTTLADGVGPAGVRAVVEGFLLAAHTGPRSGRRAAAAPAERRLLLVGDAQQEDVAAAVTAAGATALARDLAATPSNLKDPAWMVEQARGLAREHRLSVEVRDEDRLRAEGFGGILAVGAGSASPPALVQVRHVPRVRRRVPRVVLVGKGITFDTGGLSLKPRESMLAMKTDMTGSAVVLATVVAAAQLDLPVQVTALLPLAENALGAASYRPGDVVRHYGGRTTEIANTDAEGRIVLGDALAYADAHLDPDVVVDVATLTGAATQGLGKRHGALFTGDDELAAALLAASDTSGERLWRMPLVEDYVELIASDLADSRQVSGVPGAGAGSILAALFLRPFAGQRRWAHLDVAGPARSDGPEHEVGKGATGFGVRVLLAWLRSLDG